MALEEGDGLDREGWRMIPCSWSQSLGLRNRLREGFPWLCVLESDGGFGGRGYILRSRVTKSENKRCECDLTIDGQNTIEA